MKSAIWENFAEFVPEVSVQPLPRSQPATGQLSHTAVRLHVYLVFVKSIEQELKIQLRKSLAQEFRL